MYNFFMNNELSSPKRSVGRPRAFDRDAALDIAMDLFWRRGFEATSTTQLVAAMGISQPSLYAAFGSKEALYREALDLYVRRHGVLIPRMLQMPGTAREAIATLLLGAAKQYTDQSHAPGCMVACSALQGDPEHGEIQAHVAGLRDDGERAIKQRLDRARAAGELPARCDTGLLAGYFAMVIQGLAIQAHDGASAGSLKRMAQMAMSAWPADA